MTYTQKDKQKRGAVLESEIRASANFFKCWIWKLKTGFTGTPFDQLLLYSERNYALELKTVAIPRLAYSAVRDNQRTGLTSFMAKGRNHVSVILVNWRDTSNNVNRLFVIPWAEVKADVCSGRKGSIDIERYPELPRIKLGKGKYGWELAKLKELWLFGNYND